MKEITFIVPLLKGTELVSSLVKAFRCLNRLSGQELNARARFVVVLDGPDHECRDALIRSNLVSPLELEIVTLTRHVGVAGAIFAGLTVATEESAVVCFGGDLQEPLDTLIDLASEALDGAEVVLGQRLTRSDGLVSDFFSSLYWRLARTYVDKSLPRGGFDVFALSPTARRSLLRLPGARPNITTQIFKLGFPITYVQFDRIPRKTGKSSWTSSRKFQLALDSLFATNPQGTARLLARLLPLAMAIPILTGLLMSILFHLSVFQAIALMSAITFLLNFILLSNFFILYQVSLLLDELYQPSKFEILERHSAEGT